jgi:8-oxo-dGTP diphosphatase
LKENIALGLLRSEDSILLVKEAYGGHFWTLPGGIVEPGETFAEAAVREVREETGLEVRVQGMVFLRNRPDQILIVFALEACGGRLLESVPGEIESVKWFDLDSVNKCGVR